jgi:hypothetical protein
MPVLLPLAAVRLLPHFLLLHRLFCSWAGYETARLLFALLALTEALFTSEYFVEGAKEVK